MWDDFDPDGDEDDPYGHEQPVRGSAPSPGERFLHALGQLHRLHLCGRLPAHPTEFDIEDVARIVGVWPDLELVVADDEGTRFHFACEALFIKRTQPSSNALIWTPVCQVPSTGWPPAGAGIVSVEEAAGPAWCATRGQADMRGSGWPQDRVSS